MFYIKYSNEVEAATRRKKQRLAVYDCKPLLLYDP